MADLAMDLSSHNPSDLGFFQAAKAAGVKAVIIKLTEGSRDGSNYVNPKAAEQIRNAVKCDMIVHAYHYAKFKGEQDAKNEADFFCDVAKQMGLDATSVMVLDIEDGSNNYFATADSRAFLDRVVERGYPRVDLYTMASWIWTDRIMRGQIGRELNWWIAAYNNNRPGVDNVGTWQFSSKYPIGNVTVDMSYDFTGYYTKEQQASVPARITASGYLDTVKFNGNKVLISGWFGSDKAKGKENAFVILTANGKEIARQKITLKDRPDVNKVYPDIPDKCGFEASFDYVPAMANQKVTIIFRYTDDPEGNGNYADWSADHDFNQSVAYLDSMKSTIYSNKLTMSGWFASDCSLGLDHRFLILLSDGKEVQRVKADIVDRPDVANAYAGVYNAEKSGFNGSFDYSDKLVGKKLQLVARYSDADNGEGNHVDYWFPEFEGPALPMLDGKTVNEVLANKATIETVGGKVKLSFS